MTTPKRLRVKGHKLITYWTGAQGGYANGRCECGDWYSKGWTHHMRSVRSAHQSHLFRVMQHDAHVESFHQHRRSNTQCITSN